MPDSSKVALIVGINDYKEQPLRFSRNDAIDISTLLEQPEYDFSVTQLLDADATRANILDFLKELEKTQPKVFLFYFSGHGYENWGRAYLGTAGAERIDDGLDLSLLAQILERMKAPTKAAVALLDCCHSGAAKAWEVARPVTPQTLDECIGGFSETRAIFAACRPEQDSVSAPDSNHGLFTHYILEALASSAADYLGRVTFDGVVTYVRLRARAHEQLTVLRNDSAGELVLGSGFTPAKSEPLTLNSAQAKIEEARDKLSNYEKRLGRNMNDWSRRGYSNSTRAMIPVRRWFNRNVDRHPELAHNELFKEQRDRLTARMAHLQNLGPGDMLNGLRVEKLLGNGGFGSVWLLKGRPDNGIKQLALKVFNQNELHNDKMLSMFYRGYRAMEQLDHPRVVKVHGKSEIPVGFYMDYVEGNNLRFVPPPRDDPSAVIRLLVLAAETLQHAHLNDVVHRDIKPENLLVRYQNDGTWLPYLTDFDLAWFSSASRLASEAMAHLRYGAPEYLQVPSSDSAHKSTVDIYSFGQLAFFLIIGRDPDMLGFDRNRETLARRLHWDVPGAGKKFQEFYERSVQIDPRARYSSFGEVIDKLAEIELILAAEYRAYSFDADVFLHELAFSLSSMPGGKPPKVEREGFNTRSISDRTEIAVTILEERVTSIGNTLNLRVKFSMDQLTMQKQDRQRARRNLDIRVDTALSGFSLVATRRPQAQRNQYETAVEVVGATSDMRGVGLVREIIRNVVGTIERA